MTRPWPRASHPHAWASHSLRAMSQQPGLNATRTPQDGASAVVVDLAGDQAMLGLGVQVRRLRQDCGLSQHALAQLLRTTQSAVARLEAGRQEPTVATLRRLAQVLGCEFVVRIAPSAAA